MNHWIVAPVILPATLAPLMLLSMRYHDDLQRIFSVAGTAALALISVGLLFATRDGSIGVYELGGWRAPFGIVLVLDRLSATMVALTAFLALGVLLYAIGSGWDARGRHFHPLFQFQLMGVCGAFLTGDAFNLFVFFEVLLIASYGLMIHAGGATRLRAGVQYVAYNLLGSTLFLFALGVLYAVTGTLNMADLAVRAAELPPEQTALLRVGAVMLLLVFCVKAALLPLHFWLPETYANAPAPVAALFAIMTKVGAYAIIRMYTLVFGPDLPAVSGLMDTWLLPLALVTLAVGAIGVLGSSRLSRLACFAAIASMGTLLTAVSLFTPEAISAALYYAVHSTFATAAMFLVVDLVNERRPGAGDAFEPAPPIAMQGFVASLFFAAAIAMAGMPPLSGFLGKLLVLDAARSDPQAGLIWATVLAASLVTILGFARAGSVIFWKTEAAGSEAQPAAMTADGEAVPSLALAYAAAGAMFVPLIGATVLAGPVSEHMALIAAQLDAPSAYINAVLGAR